MIRKLKINFLQLLISFILAGLLSYLLLVNFSFFWFIGKLFKIIITSALTLILVAGVYSLLSIFFQAVQAHKLRKNIVITFLSIIFSFPPIIIIFENYWYKVPRSWIYGLGTKFEHLSFFVFLFVFIPFVVFLLVNLFLDIIQFTFSDSNIIGTYFSYRYIFPVSIILTLLCFSITSLPALEQNTYPFSEFFFRTYSIIKFHLNDQIFTDVLMSDDNWLAYINDISIQDYQNTWPFSAGEFQKIGNNLEILEDYQNKNGVKIYIVIVPNKNTIYPEYIPSEIPVLSEVSRINQFMSLSEEYGDIKVIDLREAFFQAKENELIYYKTDTHWNSRGAYLGYSMLVNEINRDFPQITAFSFDHFESALVEDEEGGLAALIEMDIDEEFYSLWYKDKSSFQFHQGPEYTEDYYSLWYKDKSAFQIHQGPEYTIINQTGDKDLRIVMFHDSFGFNLLPLLAEHSKTLVGVYSWIFQPEILEYYEPDIIIFERTERFLNYFLQNLEH